MNLSEKEKRLIFGALSAAFIANLLGYAFIVPILPSWKLQFGLSNTHSTALVSLWAVPLFFLGPKTGRLVDRFGAGRIILASMILLSITSLLYLAATAELIGGAFYLLAFARLSHGLAGAAVMTAGFAAASEIWPLKFGEISGKLVGTAVIGGLLGPVIGGLTFEYSETFAFLILSIIPALVIPFAFFASKKLSGKPENKAQGGVSIGVFLRNPILLRLGFLVVLATIATGALEAGIPLFLAEGLGMGSGMIGLVILVMVLVQGLGGWIWGIQVDKSGPVRFMIFGWIIVTITLLACGYVATDLSNDSAIWLIIGILAAFQFSIAATQVPMLPMIDTATTHAYGSGSAGLAFGAFGTAWAAGTIIGPMLIGPVLDYSGSWAITLGILAIPMVLGLVITIANSHELSSCYEAEMSMRKESE